MEISKKEDTVAPPLFDKITTLFLSTPYNLQQNSTIYQKIKQAAWKTSLFTSVNHLLLVETTSKQIVIT